MAESNEETARLLEERHDVQHHQNKMVNILDVDENTTTVHPEQILSILENLDRNMKLLVLSVSGESWEEKNYFISIICEYLAECERSNKPNIESWHAEVETIHPVREIAGKTAGVVMVNRPFQVPIRGDGSSKVTVLIISVSDSFTNNDNASSDIYSFLWAHHHLVYQGDRPIGSPLQTLEGRVEAARDQQRDMQFGKLLLMYGNQELGECKGITSYTGAKQNIPRRLSAWFSKMKEIKLPSTGARRGVFRNMNAPVTVQEGYRQHLEQVAKMVDQLLQGHDYAGLTSVRAYQALIQEQEVSGQAVTIPSEERVENLLKAQDSLLSFLNQVDKDLGETKFRFCCDANAKQQIEEAERRSTGDLENIKRQFPDFNGWNEAQKQLDRKFTDKTTEYKKFCKRRQGVILGVVCGCAGIGIITALAILSALTC